MSKLTLAPICLIGCSLAACDVTARGGGSFNTPSGVRADVAKCTTGPDACYRSASAACAGPYQVLNSERHWGGILGETGNGTMWYVMTYQCGPSDGKLPPFPMRDSTINANIHID